MADIVWLDQIETDELRIGIDNWGGLYIKSEEKTNDPIALDPNVVEKIIEARKEII